MVHSGTLIAYDQAGVTYRQRFTPRETNLLFLNVGEYELPPGSASGPLQTPGHETLLWMWRGTATAAVNGSECCLANYDVLYVPLGAAFTLRNDGGEVARIFQTSAPATNVHPVHHAVWEERRRDESRIRHLKGKDVFLMFDVSEGADKLMAGYTFFEAHARSWPPHNHTDQEEVYIFIQGQGAMEVYESEESLSFVHSVHEGDMVTIPFLNYHPVFSQSEPLQFIWCIAGERYWVGDKNKDFMKGSADKITT
jgi:mannose-6-phosphate isomerase-like protein (cupin superfamily)